MKSGENMAYQSTLSIKLLKQTVLLLLVAFNGLLVSANHSDDIRHALLEAADKRLADDAIYQRALTSGDAKLQRLALLSIGRVGAPSAIKTISPFLYAPQPAVREMAAFAMGIASNKEAIALLAKRLKQEHNPQVMAEILSALGVVGPKQDGLDIIAIILPYLDNTHESVVTASCDALAYAWTMHRDSISVPNSTQVFKLLSLSQQNSSAADHCLYALTRLRTEVALYEQQQMLKTIASLTTKNQHLLMTLIVSAQKNTAYLPYIKNQLRAEASIEEKAEAAKALAMLGYKSELVNSYQEIIDAKPAAIKIGFLDGLSANKPEKEWFPWLVILSKDQSGWVNSRASSTLFALDPEQYAPVFKTLLSAPSAATQHTALTILRSFEFKQKQALLALARNSEFATVREVITQMDSSAKQDQNDRPEEAEQDSIPASTPMAASEVLSKANARLKIKTSKGDVTIQLMPSAAYTSYRFYDLAMKGFYDGIEFHRVIPNFVAQGGDPTATGSGGPGYSIREELYPSSHIRGTLGMATSGKDTGGSQFFFNFKDNLHLDRRYTIFARVIDGMNTVDSLEIGDKVISISQIKTQ